MKGLTERQAEILKFVSNYTNEHTCPPTIRETAEFFNVSVRAIQDHFTALEKKGYLTKVGKQSRSIRVVDSTEKQYAAKKVPLLGKIMVGKPVFCQENYEQVFSISAPFVKPGKDCFALRIKDDSMINAGINAEDFVIIQQQHTAENGQIVAAIVEDEITLKRYFKETSRIRLQSENPKYKPMYSNEVKILGILTYIIREYQ